MLQTSENAEKGLQKNRNWSGLSSIHYPSDLSYASSKIHSSVSAWFLSFKEGKSRDGLMHYIKNGINAEDPCG